MTQRPIPILRREPPLGPNPDYSRFIYADPPSHDFCVGLIIADLMRQYHGAPEPLHVKFALMNGQLGVVNYAERPMMGGNPHACGLSATYSHTMMANVLRPAIAMLGAVEDPPINAPWVVEPIAQYVEYDYHIGHLIDAGREGFKPPQWMPPQWAFDEVDARLQGAKPIVITLRETPVQPERNSQLDEWFKFAKWVECEVDNPVLFLRDTCKAAEPLVSFNTWPRASRNTYVRAALAQRAFLNLMVGNGPNVWCLFSSAPYLTFKQLVPALPDWDHGNAKGWREQDHMEIGDQLPWATPQQRFTWTDDTFENLCAAFNDFLKVA